MEIMGMSKDAREIGIIRRALFLLACIFIGGFWFFRDSHFQKAGRQSRIKVSFPQKHLVL
jgi:hypothetical protein